MWLLWIIIGEEDIPLSAKLVCHPHKCTHNRARLSETPRKKLAIPRCYFRWISFATVPGVQGDKRCSILWVVTLLEAAQNSSVDADTSAFSHPGGVGEPGILGQQCLVSAFK